MTHSSKGLPDFVLFFLHVSTPLSRCVLQPVEAFFFVVWDGWLWLPRNHTISFLSSREEHFCHKIGINDLRLIWIRPANPQAHLSTTHHGQGAMCPCVSGNRVSFLHHMVFMGAGDWCSVKPGRLPKRGSTFSSQVNDITFWL